MPASDTDLNARWTMLLRRWLFAGMAMAVTLGLASVWRDYMKAGGGAPIYWVEDAYIHLSIGRDLVEHGVYGVTPHEFTSSSSSPLWTLMLATLMAVAGTDARLALALNLVAALALAAIVTHVLGRNATSPLARWFAVAAAALVVLLVAPVPLILSGMEHLGHAAAMVAAVWWLSRRLADGGPPVRDLPLFCLLLALPLWRYESLWLHALGTGMALALGERRLACLIAAAGALPVVAFGAIATAHGWPFLPAPILAKTVYLADAPDGWTIWLIKYLAWWPVKRLVAFVPELLAMMVAAAWWLAWTLRSDRRSWRTAHWLAVLFFLLGSWTHATFAAFGWGGRYEAYLLALGLVTLAIALPRTDWRAAARSRARACLGGALAAAFVCCAGLRTWYQHVDLPGRAETVLLRDVWPGRMIAEYCGATPCQLQVMAMNIGALSWYAGPRLTDLLALGDREVLTLLRHHRLDGTAVRRLADERQIDVALIFDDWYGIWIGGRPPLVRVATLVQHTVWPTPLSIYARDEIRAVRVAQALKRAARTAPSQMSIEYETAFR